MKRSAKDIQEMTDRFRGAIRKSGVKLTPQRLEIFREAALTDDHPRIETIFRNVRRKMPNVSLDTVYRTLDLFQELGLVSTVRPLAGPTRFDADTKPHHHFVCTRCGSVHDLVDAGFDRLTASPSARKLGRVDSAHVELRGLCASCRRGRNDR